MPPPGAISLRHETEVIGTPAFAGALAKGKKAELVTADHGFKALEKEIKINWLK